MNVDGGLIDNKSSFVKLLFSNDFYVSKEQFEKFMKVIISQDVNIQPEFNSESCIIINGNDNIDENSLKKCKEILEKTILDLKIQRKNKFI